MDIHGAHIFKSGRWNSQTFTDADLDGIVTTFNALAQEGRVPLKFGHGNSETDQPFRQGMPALGWVSKVWRVGKDLFADFTDIPKVVFEAIKKGIFKFVSIELLADAERDGKRFPYVLDAVALLGADPPAVSGLEDLQKLTLSRASFTFSKALAFTRQTNHSLSGDSDPMDELKKALAERDAALAKLAAHESKDERAKITMAREKATTMLEAAVRERHITPAQRDNLRVALKVDADSVVDLDFAALQALTHLSFEDAKKRMASRSAFSRDPEVEIKDDGSARDTCESMVAAIRAHAEKTGLDTFTACTDLVRKNPKFARQYLAFNFAAPDA